MGMLLLFGVNSIVNRIQEGLGKPYDTERSWKAWLFQGIDPEDDISFGYVIALSGVYVYVRLIYQLMKMAYRLMATKGTTEKRY